MIYIDDKQMSPSFNGWKAHAPVDFDMIGDYLIVQQYLTLNINAPNQNNQIFSQKFQEPANQLTKGIMEHYSPPKGSNKIKQSTFHNFPKHLITILKRCMNFSTKQAITYQFGEISYEIWQFFLNCRNDSKRVLSLVFGDEGKISGANQDMQRKFGDFRKISELHSSQQIKQGQELLRRCIIDQASNLSKGFLKSQSKIKRFEDFYEYYCRFIAEIEGGPLVFSRNKRFLETLSVNCDLQ